MKPRLLFVAFAMALLLGATVTAVHALPTMQDTAVIVTVADGANLRAGPGIPFARVGSAAAGADLQVVGCSADCTWYKTADGSWIAAELLIDPPTTLPRIDAVAQATAASAPGADALRLPTPTPSVRSTTSLTLTQSNTPTLQTVVDAGAVDTTPIANANANLRSGPGTNFERMGSVQAGEALDVIGRTADGEWLQLAGDVWIAAFLVENLGVDISLVENLPTPAPTVAELVLPPAAAGAEQTPEPPDVQPQADPEPAAGARDLVVEFINPHYNCEQGEEQFEFTPGIVEKIWAYRSFQVDMYIANNGVDAIEPIWSPTRWIITDGVNEMVNDKMWQWISRYTGKYEQPTIYPGQKAGWTWIAMPVGRYEWVKAVEFEHNGQLYRQEFDLGPYGNAHNYIDCGEPRSHTDYPTPTPRAQEGS